MHSAGGSGSAIDCGDAGTSASELLIGLEDGSEDGDVGGEAAPPLPACRLHSGCASLCTPGPGPRLCDFSPALHQAPLQQACPPPLLPASSHPVCAAACVAVSRTRR